MPPRPRKPPSQTWRTFLANHVGTLASVDFYHRSRTHLSLGKDAPAPRAVQAPEMGKIVELPEVGGLHHRYERLAA